MPKHVMLGFRGDGGGNRIEGIKIIGPGVTSSPALMLSSSFVRLAFPDLPSLLRSSLISVLIFSSNTVADASLLQNRSPEANRCSAEEENKAGMVELGF